MNIPENDEKFKRTFMRDEAYHKLREWIVIGKLKPGTKLRDQDLSDTMGISRTPIREALIKLEDEGLVITKPNRWTLVSPVELKEVENIYSLVWTLESLAIEQAFHHISTRDIEEMEQLNELFGKVIKTDDKVAALHADNRFHYKIIQLSNNYELSKLLASLKVKIQRIEIHYFSHNSKHLSYFEHQQIIEALRSQELSLSINAIKANWKNSLDRIRANNED